MKIYFLCADKEQIGGSSWYRIVQAAGLSKKIYEEVLWSHVTKLDYRFLDEADMVVVQRQGSKSALNMTKSVIEMGKIVVSELDDNLWSVPPDIQYVKREWGRENIKLLEQHLALSHAVTVSTTRLAKIVKDFNQNVYVVPNLVAFEPDYQKLDAGKIRIGWTGSDTHFPDFTSDVVEAILDIKEKYKDDVDIFIFGSVPGPLLFKVTNYLFTQPHVYLMKMHALGMDIGIVPNRPNLWNECRSNIKYLEYSSVKAVTIASNIESYRNTIRHGETGLLIGKNTKKAWFNALRDMIENEQERRRIGENAFKFCYENYSVQEKQGQYSIYYEIMNKIQGG